MLVYKTMAKMSLSFCMMIESNSQKIFTLLFCTQPWPPGRHVKTEDKDGPKLHYAYMCLPYSICKRQFVRYFLASLSILLFMHVSLCTCNYFVHLQTAANIIKYAPSIVGLSLRTTNPYRPKLLRQYWPHDPRFAHHYWANSVESHCIQHRTSAQHYCINDVKNCIVCI